MSACVIATLERHKPLLAGRKKYQDCDPIDQKIYEYMADARLFEVACAIGGEYGESLGVGTFAGAHLFAVGGKEVVVKIPHCSFSHPYFTGPDEMDWSEIMIGLENNMLQVAKGIAHLPQPIDCPSFGGVAMTGMNCENLYDAFISHGSKLSLRQIKVIANALLSVSVGLKAKGYMHADIKPENICYDPAIEKCMLVDLGNMIEIAKIKQFEVIQTAMYRAPEAAAGITPDETADIWSIGAVLFELFTGELLIPIAAAIPEVEENAYLLRNFGPRCGIAAFEAFLADNHIQHAAKYEDIPSWQEVVRQTGSQEAEEMIALIEPMLRFTRRASAAELLARNV